MLFSNNESFILFNPKKMVVELFWPRQVSTLIGERLLDLES